MQPLPTVANEKKAAEQKPAPAYNYAAFSGITAQYASEAAFLWLLRSNAVTSRLYTTTDVIELDDRIEANLRGLSLNNELGWRACVDQLVYEEAGEIFTAAVVALRSRDAARIKMVSELALQKPEMTKGLISAFGWVEAEIAHFWIDRFLKVQDPVYKTLGLAVCSVRRINPEKILLSIFQDPATSRHAGLHARALRLVGELKRWDLVPAINAGMEAKAPEVRFWANWSAAVLGNQAALGNLKPWVMEDTELSDRAIRLVFSLLPVNEARAWIGEMVKKNLIRHAIRAIGVLGDPQAVSWLIQTMAQDKHTRIAGWAFSQITGIDLEKTGLSINRRAEGVAGPNDNPEDENVGMDLDEDLPWPDRNKITRLWQVHCLTMQLGHRYFQGQEITKQLLDSIYVNANQQQKELAVLQRAIYDKHTAMVNIKARNL